MGVPLWLLAVTGLSPIPWAISPEAHGGGRGVQGRDVAAAGEAHPLC